MTANLPPRGGDVRQDRGGQRRALSVLVLLILLFLPVTALAHATLIRSEPADGAVVAESPAELTLIFNEPAAPLVLKLLRPDGSILLLDQSRTEGERLSIALPALTEGTHLFSWRVASEDGHPIGGTVVFSVGRPSGGELPVLPDILGATERAAIWIARACLYLGLFAGVGGAFFLAAFAPGFHHRRLAFAIGLGLIAAPFSVAFQGIDALGLTLGAWSDAAAWKAGYGTSYGTTASIAAAALLLAFLSLFLRRLWLRRALAAVALLGVGAALAASGHASAAEPQWLTRPAVFLHAAAVAFWTGALAPLAMLFLSRANDRADALLRFSRLVPFAVAVMVPAGVALAVVQVEQPAAMLSTAYGQILSLKLVLVVLLLAIAARNRWRLTEPTLAGEGAAQRGFGRAALAETLLAIAILALAAGWRFTPPPRVLAIEAAKPFFLHIHGGTAMADITITPGRVGVTNIAIFPMLPDMTPIEAKEVELLISKRDSGIEPIRRMAEKIPTGGWRVNGLAIPLPGVWDVRLELLVSDFDKVVLAAPAEIRP
jgi:copper transport protein